MHLHKPDVGDCVLRVGFNDGQEAYILLGVSEEMSMIEGGFKVEVPAEHSNDGLAEFVASIAQAANPNAKIYVSVFRYNKKGRAVSAGPGYTIP